MGGLSWGPERGGFKKCTISVDLPCDLVLELRVQSRDSKQAQELVGFVISDTLLKYSVSSSPQL